MRLAPPDGSGALRLCFAVLILVLLGFLLVALIYDLSRVKYVVLEAVALLFGVISCVLSLFITRNHHRKKRRTAEDDAYLRLWAVLTICFGFYAYQEMEMWIFAVPRIVLIATLAPIGLFILFMTFKDPRRYILLYIGVLLLSIAISIDIVHDRGLFPLSDGYYNVEELLELLAASAFLYFTTRSYVSRAPDN